MDLVDCKSRYCLCDCFSAEMSDELDAMAKKSNSDDATVARDVMALGLAAMKLLERQAIHRPMPAKHGAKPARKSKLSGAGV